MDSLSDAERRYGYGKWTLSGIFGTAKHPAEYGGSYGGLKGYQSDESPYGDAQGFLTASTTNNTDPALAYEYDERGDLKPVNASVAKLKEAVN